MQNTEVGVCLVPSKNSKTNVVENRVVGNEVREVTEARSCRALSAIART